MGSNFKKYLDSLDMNYVTYPADMDRELLWHDSRSNENICKASIINVDNHYAILLLAESEEINLDHIKALSGADSVRLVSEAEYQQLFPEIEYGVLSLLGTISNIRVYCSRKVFQQPDMYFNMDRDNEIIKIPTDEFTRRTITIVGSFG
ncbi:hypothetical protein GF337_12365 [candidate division KSB1 bacterium]|nr:hypothetical protein [candidate division KSB1 bacterium]